LKTRRFTGDYADDGKARRLSVREAAGHRCIRCGHPFESGKHGKGEWSPCDEKCTHGGPVRSVGITIEAQWRVLTVHHLDGDKSNDAWWNTLALCQRCHLQVQTRVDPRIPYFLEHSEWFKPYVAGFYVWKYEGALISREEVESRLSELLAYEQMAQ
jgi:hypothetical protein